MSTMTTDEPTGAAKTQLLLSVYRMAFEEITWRRVAGYRTIIIGFGYFGLLIALVAFNRHMPWGVRACMGAVVLLGSVFGAGYLASNYGKYMEAMRRMVQIEEYLGAYAPDYLGPLGPLMAADRKKMPDVRLAKNLIPFWSIIAFLIGGILTAVGILTMNPPG